jgi:hypothetical protein
MIHGQVKVTSGILYFLIRKGGRVKGEKRIKKLSRNRISFLLFTSVLRKKTFVIVGVDTACILVGCVCFCIVEAVLIIVNLQQNNNNDIIVSAVQFSTRFFLYNHARILLLAGLRTLPKVFNTSEIALLGRGHSFFLLSVLKTV